MTDLLDRARAVAGELPDCEARDVVLALMREVERHGAEYRTIKSAKETLALAREIRREALREAAEIAKRLDSANPGHWKVTRDDVAVAILARAEPAPKSSHPAHFAGGSGAAVKGVE